MRFCLVLAALVWFADIPAPPAIEPDGVISASMMPAGLPGGAIARGARIVIPGVRLGPEEPVRASEANPPLKVAGVSVALEHTGAAATPLPLLSVSAHRIEAWIPESTPAGPARLVVTSEGRSSEPYALDIANAGFGFFPGQHPEAAPTEAATLWGTGLGASRLQLSVGGKPARTLPAQPDPCCAGRYPVRFEVPAGAPQGCFVPVIGRSPATGRVTNFAAIAVHPPGEPCRDRLDWFRESVEHASTAGFAVLARISLLLDRDYVFDYGLASFARQQSGQRPFPPLPPPNTCTGFTDRVNLRETLARRGNPTGWPAAVAPAPGSRPLDVGPITFAGPNGAKTVPGAGVLGGHLPFSHRPPLPLFTQPGRFTIQGAGGRDAGPFSAAIAVPKPLVWRNRAALSAIDRAAGATVEWTPSHKDDAVLIVAASADRITGDSAMAVCMAPAAEDRFHIPAEALANLPPSQAANPDLSYLLLLEIPVDPPARIAARGIDTAFAAFLSAAAREIEYK